MQEPKTFITQPSATVENSTFQNVLSTSQDHNAFDIDSELDMSVNYNLD